MKVAVLMKSNRYGITLYFDPDRTFEDLLKEVEDKFRASEKFFGHAKLAVEFSGRTFTEEEERRIAETIEDAAKIQILCIIEKDSNTENIHKKILIESLETIHEKDGRFYKGTLRERQVLESETSIVIIGDIDEGATVVSKGNVVVTGTIYGSVIAGAAGNLNAFIAAFHMEPLRLRIGKYYVKPIIGGSYSWARLL